MRSTGSRRDGEDVSAGRVLRPNEGGLAGPAGSLRRRRRPGSDIPQILGVAEEDLPEGNVHAVAPEQDIDLQVRIAGFGGQGVLLLGEVLAEAGLDAGLEVSWLPRTGRRCDREHRTAMCGFHSQPIDSPLVTSPSMFVAMNEPSLRKFDKSVRPGGWVIYNGDAFPADCVRDDVHVLALRLRVWPMRWATHGRRT